MLAFVTTEWCKLCRMIVTPKEFNKYPNTCMAVGNWLQHCVFGGQVTRALQVFVPSKTITFNSELHVLVRVFNKHAHLELSVKQKWRKTSLPLLVPPQRLMGAGSGAGLRWCWQLASSSHLPSSLNGHIVQAYTYLANFKSHSIFLNVTHNLKMSVNCCCCQKWWSCLSSHTPCLPVWWHEDMWPHRHPASLSLWYIFRQISAVCSLASQVLVLAQVCKKEEWGGEEKAHRLGAAHADEFMLAGGQQPGEAPPSCRLKHVSLPAGVVQISGVGKKAKQH